MNLNKAISLARIFQAANFAILLVTVWAYISTNGNQYIDAKVIFASILLHMQMAYILRYEEKFSNPLLIILAYIVICFYLSRLATLMIQEEPISLVFNRPGAENIGSNEIFNFLIFLFFGIWAIFIGATISYPKLKYRGFQIEWLNLARRRVDLLLALYLGVATIIFTLYAQYFLVDFPIFSLLLGLLANSLDYLRVVTLMTVAAIISSELNGSKKIYKYLVIAITLLFCLIIIGGSGGPMLRVGIFAVCAILAVRGSIKIRQKFLLILLIAMIITTFFGTFLKFNRGNVGLASLDTIEMALNEKGFDFLFGQITARAGYLDMAVELVNNKEYERLINFNYYLESLTDSLTPGFDVYDAPPVANALREVYLGIEKNSRAEVDSNYHSDQINCFAEYYILFGPYFSIVILTLTTYLFNFAYKYMRQRIKNEVIASLSAALVLTSYYSWLKSFGLDWILLEMVFSFYFVAVYLFLVKITIPFFKKIN